MAWRIKCPPARPRIGESPGKRRLSIPGDTVSPGMEKDAAARGAAAFGAGGLRPPGLPNKKLRPEAKPPVSAFQGALRPAAAPLRRPRRGPLSAGNVADAPRKRGASAKTLPPVMAVSPIYPPLGMLPMACRYASTSSRKPSMPSRSETRSSPRPMCFIR